MLKDVSLHGTTGFVDFTVFAGGANISNAYFYEEMDSGIRFFSKGNELIITRGGIHYKGTGGSFCEYMFGVEKPFKDLIKRDVLNRLIMFGAFLDRNENLVFTNDISGSETFHKIFLLGHAVKNYYFFVSSDSKEEPKKRQRQILQSLGKFLKRTTLITEERDEELLQGLIDSLDEPYSTVFIFKFVHRENLEFYRSFHRFYSQERLLSQDNENSLQEIALRYNIDNYQQERMKIDCMYRHPENKAIVDEYRDILLDIFKKDVVEPSEKARLHRLRTLSIRNNISSVLFDTLDDLLLRGKKIQSVEEPSYLTEARAILENLFFKAPSLKSHIIREDIAKLIRAKHLSHMNNDMTFDQILLDIGKACDEVARQNNDLSAFEELSSIITYFDRYDNVNSILSKIAFMDNYEVTEDIIRSLIGNKKEFDVLDKGLFRSLFIDELLKNKYISVFGKRKIKVLNEGIERILKNDASLREIALELKNVTEEERLYKYIRMVLKERLREVYATSDIRERLPKIRKDLKEEMKTRGVTESVFDKLMDRVLLDLKKESYYLNTLLPEILRSHNLNLREDFLTNSGLDRFYIEGIEREYIGEGELNLLR
ncbi:MAG: TIGR04442 family protein [Thermodesulfovibrionales bacterium]